jgi:transcriptional regulator GlxA family with amidase domain
VSLIHVRDWILGPSAPRKAMLLVAVVGALVAGLLAMHTIASAMGGHDDAPDSTMAMHGAVQLPDALVVPSSGSTVLSDCAGRCDPGHTVATMVCVLALLVTAVLLAVTRRSESSGWLRQAQSSGRRIIAFAAAAFAPPPNLDALSISRT